MRTAFIFVSALLAATGAAQTPPAWTELSVPGGVQTINVQSLGKVIAYAEAGQVRAYSGFARRWVTQPVNSTAVRVSNDSVLAIAAPDFHAFSAYTGEWRSLTLSPAAHLINPSNQKNDSIWLVRDGGDIWAFNAFHTSWTRLQVSGNAIAQVERHTAIVADGATLYGLSAFRGGWVVQQAGVAATYVHAAGTAGVVVAGSSIHGFSAMRDSWATHAVPGATPTWAFGDDLALAADSGAYVAFSGLRGVFSALTAPPSSTAQISETVAYVADGAGQGWAYSAVRAQWLALPVAVNPIVQLSAAAVLVSLTDRVHAFSAITGGVATAVGAVSFTSLSRSVGSLTLQDGSFKLYSAVLGQWFDAPADAQPLPPELCETSALFRTQTGLAAFNGRTGQLSRVTASGAATTQVNASSAILAAVDNSTLLVYDARRQRWLSEPLIGTPQIAIWRTTLTVIDSGGLRALGFGTFNGRLESTTLPQVPIGGRANSESGRLDLPNSIYGYSADPDVLTLWQYPDFHRMFVGGSEMDVRVQSGGAGTGFFFLATRALASPLPVAGLGELELDPSALVLLTGLPVPMSQGHGELRFQVPDDPALRGLAIAFQAVVVPTVGNAYLSQSTGVLLF
ncbi:MAG: hypothetical protein IPM13_17985 [Phycisphaerales bacterium]|nr:hypothetical protein [Phycisphaerales bacterium]